MLHRVDIHRCLRDTALQFPNVKLYLSSRVQTVDIKKGTITLQNGDRHQGDVIIGADGVHSRTVEFTSITGDRIQNSKTGTNAYRFMVATEKARAADTVVSKFLDSYDYTTTCRLWGRTSRPKTSLITYTCRNATLLNCIFETPASPENSHGEWSSPCTTQEILNLIEDWPDPFRHLVALAEDPKRWALVARDVPVTFTEGKLVLVGDAAHPTHPTYGMGTGMAIEDAAVLGVLLDRTATGDVVAQRLDCYNTLRYKRAVTVKYTSEVKRSWWTDENAARLLNRFVPGARIPSIVHDYVWPVNVVADAEAALRTLLV